MITRRTGERLCRDAYEYEDLAARLRAAGFDKEANGVSEIARQCGRIGNAVLDKLKVAS